jgi:hypothetical protein
MDETCHDVVTVGCLAVLEERRIEFLLEAAGHLRRKVFG